MVFLDLIIQTPRVGPESCIVTTNRHNMIPPTVFFQLPVAVHLSLGLNPVAAVCPQRGLGLGYYGSACERQHSGSVTATSASQLTTVNVRVDLGQQLMVQLMLIKVGMRGGRHRK